MGTNQQLKQLTNKQNHKFVVSSTTWHSNKWQILFINQYSDWSTWTQRQTASFQTQLVVYHLPLYNCNLILTLYITVSELTFILQQLGCHQYTVNSHVSPHPHRSEVTEAFSPHCSSYWAQPPPGIIIHLDSPIVLLGQRRVNTQNKSEMNPEF